MCLFVVVCCYCRCNCIVSNICSAGQSKHIPGHRIQRSTRGAENFCSINMSRNARSLSLPLSLSYIFLCFLASPPTAWHFRSFVSVSVSVVAVTTIIIIIFIIIYLWFFLASHLMRHLIESCVRGKSQLGIFI